MGLLRSYTRLAVDYTNQQSKMHLVSLGRELECKVTNDLAPSTAVAMVISQGTNIEIGRNQTGAHKNNVHALAVA
jgi:hypothetical protein